MWVLGQILAIVAEVKVSTGFTAPAIARVNITVTHITGHHKCRCRGIVQVVKHHHGGMLGPPESVVLVVVPLTQAQKCLASIKEFTLHYLILVFRVSWYITHFNLRHTRQGWNINLPHRYNVGQNNTLGPENSHEG